MIRRNKESRSAMSVVGWKRGFKMESRCHAIQKLTTSDSYDTSRMMRLMSHKDFSTRKDFLLVFTVEHTMNNVSSMYQKNALPLAFLIRPRRGAAFTIGRCAP